MDCEYNVRCERLAQQQFNPAAVQPCGSSTLRQFNPAVSKKERLCLPSVGEVRVRVRSCVYKHVCVFVACLRNKGAVV